MGPTTETQGARAAGIRSPLLIGGIALGLGWSADLLFYGEGLGLSVPVFVLLMLAALFGLARVERVRPRRQNLWLFAPLAFVAAMVMVRTDPFLLFLNFVFGLLLLGLIAYFFAAGAVNRLRLREFFAAPLLAAGYALVRPVRLLSGFGPDGPRRPLRHYILPALRGLLLALPVLIAFSILFASADLVFAQMVRDLLDFKIPPPLLDLLWQVVIALGTAWFYAGALVYAFRQAEGRDRTLVLGSPAPPLFRLGTIETFTLLTSVGLLFLLFVWIQFTYLFGGASMLAAGGYTYAEYARRGFMELVAVSLLTLLLILGLERIARLETDGHENGFTLLASVLVGLVLIILASAFHRLNLYEEAYGFTRLRVYSQVFMLWLGLLLLWLLITRWTHSLSDGARHGPEARQPRRRRRQPDPARTARPSAGTLRFTGVNLRFTGVNLRFTPLRSVNLRFGMGAFLCALGFVISLNLLNPDAFIARQNLARYAAGGELDVRYLTRLSDDAVPVLARSLNRLVPSDRLLLRQHLRRRHARLEDRAARTGWPAFHLGHHRAHRALHRAGITPE